MTDVDVAIVGAGPAGLAAALQLTAAGLSIAHVEARDRIGGRTHTVALGRHRGIDVGAHWLHARHANPLTKEAKRPTNGQWSSMATKFSAPGAR
jgi:monoamine oxidase